MYITKIVCHCYVVVSLRICDRSGLLVGWIAAHSGSSRPYLFSFIRLATIEFWQPDIPSSENLSVANIDLHELVVVSTCEECSLMREYFKSPNFSVMMRELVDNLFF